MILIDVYMYVNTPFRSANLSCAKLSIFKFPITANDSELTLLGFLSYDHKELLYMYDMYAGMCTVLKTVVFSLCTRRGFEKLIMV